MANAANAALPLSNIINISLVAPGVQLGVPNMSALGIITQATSPASWSSGQTYGVYTNPTAVGVDWGTTSDVYNMAVNIFAQSPNILTGGGYLVIVPRLQSPSLESIQNCLIRISGTVFFEGFLIDQELYTQSATFAALAAYVQTTTLMFFYCSSQATDLQPGSILSNAQAAGQYRTRCMYYGSALTNGQTQLFAAAYAGRGMSINFSGSNTVLSMQLQSLANILPDQTVTQAAYLLAQTAGVDIYPSVSGVPCVLTSGTNLYFDQVYCRTWIAFQLGVNGFNYLKNAAQVPGKVPLTEIGMTGLRNAYTQAFIQGVSNGYLAPGTWTLPFSFGNPASFAANITAQGYYIVSQPVAQLTSSQVQARQAPLVQAAIQEAGAINSSSVIVYVNP